MVKKLFHNFFKNGRSLITREHSNILSAAFIIMVTVLASAFLGVIRNRLLISYFYHQKEALDAYWAAFRLPDMIFQLLVVSALSAAFIPVFSDLVSKSKKQANYVASSIITIIISALTLFALIIIVFAKPLSGTLAQGFNSQQIHLMANLTRIMTFAQIFFGISNFLTGVIQSHKRFLIPAISPLLYNLGIILGTITLSSSLGIYGPAIGVIFGSILHLLVQIPLAKRLDFSFSPVFDFKNKYVRKVGKLMLPRTLALSVSQVEQTAVVFFATSLQSGSLTMVYIAQQLAKLPVRLFGIPIGQASLPFFAKLTAQNKLKKLADMVNNSLLEILFLSLPASAIILVLRIPLVRLAYGASSFPWEDTVTTGSLVAILSVSIVASSLTHLVIRVFYALQNTLVPLIIALITAAISITLSVFFIFYLKTGVLGLAVAITIASLIEVVLLVTTLFTQAHFELNKLFVPIFKMAIATFVTVFSLWIPLRLLDQLIFDTTRTLPLIALTFIVFVIGLSIYLSFSYLLRIDQLRIFFKLARKIGNWQQALAKTEEPLETTEPTA